jgi:hypothetical protein
MPIAAKWTSCHDQDHRSALQSLLFGKLPRADRHYLRLRRRFDAVLPNGRTAARRVDEAASGRAPGGMAVRGRQAGWQGSLVWKPGFLGALKRLITTAAPFRHLPPVRSWAIVRSSRQRLDANNRHDLFAQSISIPAN